MRRSKTEICMEILSILSQRSLSRITHIMRDLNTNRVLLKQNLTFMIKHDMVEEKCDGKCVIAYCITKKGSSVLNAFIELRQILPIFEESLN